MYISRFLSPRLVYYASESTRVAMLARVPAPDEIHRCFPQPRGIRRLVRVVDESADDNLADPKVEVISVPDLITDLVADTAIPGHPWTGKAKLSQGDRAIEFLGN